MIDQQSKTRLTGNIMLFVCAMIWGLAFVAQKAGGAAGPLTCNGVRSLIGFVVLLALTPLMDRMGLSRKPQTPSEKKATLRAGILCGLSLFAASNLQQFGMQSGHISEGKAAFMTALYIVMVPVFGIFLRRPTTVFHWIGALIALVGLYLLCAMGETGFGESEMLLAGCAMMFAIQITLVDYYREADGIRVACMQMLVVGILNLPLMFIFENPTVGVLLEHGWEILYLGVMSSAGAYTLQILGQKRADPTTASLLMSLESVFGALFGWLIAGHGLGIYELIGCVLMFGAVVLVQLPAPKKKTEGSV